MITLTLPEVIDAMRSVVDIANTDAPDGVFRYRSDGETGNCYYSSALNGKPGRGCIVGETLRTLGVPVGEIAQLDQLSPSASRALEDLCTRKIIKFATPDDANGITDLLAAAQSEQDAGASWNDALRVGLADID